MMHRSWTTVFFEHVVNENNSLRSYFSHKLLLIFNLKLKRGCIKTSIEHWDHYSAHTKAQILRYRDVGLAVGQGMTNVNALEFVFNNPQQWKSRDALGVREGEGGVTKLRGEIVVYSRRPLTKSRECTSNRMLHKQKTNLAEIWYAHSGHVVLLLFLMLSGHLVFPCVELWTLFTEFHCLCYTAHKQEQVDHMTNSFTPLQPVEGFVQAHNLMVER